MSALASGLIQRHTGLWLNDRWYRLAWVVWPQTASLLLAGWFMIGSPVGGQASFPWAKPATATALGEQTYELRDQAKTNPQALTRLEQIANGGDAMAEFALATLYDPDFNFGKLTPPDIETAITWYQKAAEKGHSSAQQDLGVKYYEAKWLPANYESPLLARKRPPRATPWRNRFMGIMNEEGRGIPVNKMFALQWFQRAANNGDPIGQIRVGDAYWFGNGYDKNRTEGVIWYPKAAELGNAYAQMSVGEALFYGIGAERNVEQAFAFFQRSADNGNAQSQFDLGMAYDQGLGTEANPVKAFEVVQEGRGER